MSVVLKPLTIRLQGQGAVEVEIEIQGRTFSIDSERLEIPFSVTNPLDRDLVLRLDLSAEGSADITATLREDVMQFSARERLDNLLIIEPNTTVVEGEDASIRITGGEQ